MDCRPISLEEVEWTLAKRKWDRLQAHYSQVAEDEERTARLEEELGGQTPAYEEGLQMREAGIDPRQVVQEATAAQHSVPSTAPRKPAKHVTTPGPAPKEVPIPVGLQTAREAFLARVATGSQKGPGRAKSGRPSIPGPSPKLEQSQDPTPSSQPSESKKPSRTAAGSSHAAGSAPAKSTPKARTVES